MAKLKVCFEIKTLRDIHEDPLRLIFLFLNAEV